MVNHRIVLLVRELPLTPEEEEARARMDARVVKVRKGCEDDVERCDHAYSFDPNIIQHYPDRGELLKSDNQPTPKLDDLEPPTGYHIEKRGVGWMKLIHTKTGEVVGGKALRREDMQELINSLDPYHFDPGAKV